MCILTAKLSSSLEVKVSDLFKCLTVFNRNLENMILLGYFLFHHFMQVQLKGRPSSMQVFSG